MQVEQLLKQTRGDLGKMSTQALNDLSEALTRMHSSGELEAAVYADCITRIDAAKQTKFTRVESFPVTPDYTKRSRRQRIIPGDSELSSPESKGE